MSKCRVIFQPENKGVVVDRETTLLQAAEQAQIYINSVCGGEGVCGKCKLVVKSGEVQSEPTNLLSREEIRKGYVLACLTKVLSDLLVVEIPPEARIEGEQILVKEKPAVLVPTESEEIQRHEEAEERVVFTHSPLATKVFLQLPPPSLQDNISDLDRLYREIWRTRDIPIMQMGLAMTKNLSRLLRSSNWQVTVTLGKRNGTVEIVQVEPGNTSDRNYGIVVDVGTTTVVAYLVDLHTKRTLGTRASYNRQMAYGADVISRIIFAEERGGLEILHQAIVENINDLIAPLVSESKIKLTDVTAVMCAGNPTMIHLLLGLEPYYIRREPYIPTANFFPVIRAAEVGIKINPRGLLKCMPGVSSYVGGDITAGVLASGMTDSEELAMFIDMGTNGELVLGNRGWLVCCACSVGPAFEGQGIKCGMRASRGAIQRVRIDPKTYEVTYQTIGEAPPRGICGSGLIDSLSELFLAGIIDRQGKFNTDISTRRLRESEEEGKEFVIAWAEETEGDRDIVITEVDIDNLIRSKAAIFSGAMVLADSLGFHLNEIQKFYIGGAFGNYLDLEKAVNIGLLPDLPLERMQFIGNSSITGAKMAMLSYEALQKAEEIARMMTYLELSVKPGYMDQFVSALFLPHTDINLFPSVREKLHLA